MNIDLLFTIRTHTTSDYSYSLQLITSLIIDLLNINITIYIFYY